MSELVKTYKSSSALFLLPFFFFEAQAGLDPLYSGDDLGLLVLGLHA